MEVLLPDATSFCNFNSRVTICHGAPHGPFQFVAWGASLDGCLVQLVAGPRAHSAGACAVLSATPTHTLSVTLSCTSRAPARRGSLLVSEGGAVKCCPPTPPGRTRLSRASATSSRASATQRYLLVVPPCPHRTPSTPKTARLRRSPSRPVRPSLTPLRLVDVGTNADDACASRPSDPCGERSDVSRRLLCQALLSIGTHFAHALQDDGCG